ncbi:MAG: response regulator transcription factor [Verrucomicrobiota bacterium]
MNVLIADDSEIMRFCIQDTVQKMSGVEPDIAENGEEAMKLFHQGSYDLVIIDIVMPRINGIICVQEMLKAKPNTKILVISSLTNTSQQALDFGAHGFVTKPFTTDQLKVSLKPFFES